MPPIPDSSALLLCGGMSSRMGRPKALLPWRGRPMVLHVSEVLLAMVEDVVVVTSAVLNLDAIDFGDRVQVVVDRAPRMGPLAGIRDGLARVKGTRAFVTGTDVPNISPPFVRGLFAREGAVAPESDGHVQSLTAIYPACAADAAEQLIRAGRMRPLFLLEAMGYARVPEAELPGFESSRGFNTPAAYLAALRADGQEGHVRVVVSPRIGRAPGASPLQVAPGHLRDVLRKAERLGGPPCATDGGGWQVHLNGQPVDLDGDLTLPVGPGDEVGVGRRNTDDR